jgi:hypothetical protein
MALLTIEGVYRNGEVELAETPENLPPEARVLVTFLSPLPQEAAERLLRRMREGIDFGGHFEREEIYEERLRQLDG